ncbi:hypothetical protein [Sulfurovum sp.]|uniref:hypothetical protein n=1 Tax=Sulfurovum sp. TaxID=1969726 RepID=UPI0025F0F691|nr:hypothetical protein [Sulfurovum sp.]
MQKVFFIILLLSSCYVDLHAKGSEWRKFEYYNKSPSPRAYNFDENVSYLELRHYEVDGTYKKLAKKGYRVLWKVYRKPLSSFDPALVKRFISSLPNLSSETDLVKYSEAHNLNGTDLHYFIGNIFYIDTNGRIWRMNTQKDLLSFVLPIDNTADLSMVMWLKNEGSVISYRKRTKGYDMKVEVNDEMNADEKKCGIYTYRMFIDKNGKIGKKELLKFNYTGCATP